MYLSITYLCVYIKSYVSYVLQDQLIAIYFTFILRDVDEKLMKKKKN